MNATMGHPRRIGMLATVALLAVLAPRGAAAQSYGTNDQVLTVDATSFLGFGATTVFQSDGYLHKQNFGELNLYAPLQLPDGAVITQICLYALNADPANVVDLSLQAQKLATPGNPGTVVTIPGTLLIANFHFGYGTVCTDTLSYVLHETADVDGDGTSELVAHRLWASVPFGNFALGGARITWHRQVSPPPLTPSFDDVPADNQFYPYIEALKASGITGGCQANPPRFCPNAPLTRAQMAAFLSQALGLHWPL
jgi:hypothetical protein